MTTKAKKPQVTEEAVEVVEKVATETKAKVSKSTSGVKESVEDVGPVFDEFLDHQKKAVEETAKALQSLIPDKVQEHGKAAFREATEGYRKLFNTLIDEVVDAIEKFRPDEPTNGKKK